jgi:ribosomal protein L11 methyltransferase
LNGTHVLDYGCGSGILAVAAVALGADGAEAVDIDPQALLATAENARKNGVAPRVRCYLPEQLSPSLAADVVVANILANPLIDLATELSGRVLPGGRIVLSGILAEQAMDVREAYASDFAFDPVAEKEGWARLSGVKR